MMSEKNGVASTESRISNVGTLFEEVAKLEERKTFYHTIYLTVELR